MEHWKPIAPILSTVVVVLALVLSLGCGLMMVGDPVKEHDVSAEDDGEENLKAIRAILLDQANRRTEEQASSPSAQPSSPGSGVSDGLPPAVEPSSTRPGPSPTSAAGQMDSSAKLPWSPTAPQRPSVPDRPVPAYTSPAPVGPDYSGSIRCAPDGMGGQRCLGR